MNIGLCANTSWYLYNFRKNLIAELQRRGHAVSAIAPADDYSPCFEALGVRWYPLPLHQTSKHPAREIVAVLQLWRILRRLRPDALLTFTIKCNLYAGLVSRVVGFRQIANVSGLGEAFEADNALNRFIRAGYRQALRPAHKVFFQNQEDLQVFVQQQILPAALCERLPGSGVDLSRFRPLTTPNDPAAPRIFLMFGRILPAKGYDLFLQAAQHINQDAPRRAAFWILGMQDGSRKDSRALFEKILDYHGKKIITYFPETDQVLPILQQADVVVLPSRYHEGVPRSLLEALACGKPIITTNWKGCRDAVADGINGYRVEVGDLDALERAMRLLRDADRELLDKMGAASRQKAEREFDERIVLARYVVEIERTRDTAVTKA